MTSSGEGRPEATRCVRFDFRGQLDAVPPAVATTTAVIARTLLCHADEHRGREASLRLEFRPPDGLDVTLTDPECSPACMTQAHGLLFNTGRAVLATSQDGGLLLRWGLTATEARSHSGWLRTRRWRARRTPSRHGAGHLGHRS